MTELEQLSAIRLLKAIRAIVDLIPEPEILKDKEDKHLESIYLQQKESAKQNHIAA